jgi:YggT family protein
MAQLISLIATFLWLAIFARVILSWFPNQSSRLRNPIVMFIYSVTDPILSPIRRVMPKIGMLDLSPLVALLGISFIQQLLLGFVG